MKKAGSCHLLPFLMRGAAGFIDSDNLTILKCPKSKNFDELEVLRDHDALALTSTSQVHVNVEIF
jgi:hypothetical protein